jgi:hypothetical protein
MHFIGWQAREAAIPAPSIAATFALQSELFSLFSLLLAPGHSLT